MIKSISRKMKYLLVAVFAFIFSITALVIGAPKAHAAWNGRGSGTENDPYQITKKSELITFRNIVNGTDTSSYEDRKPASCGILMADIDFEGDIWIPISIRTNYDDYRGTFDGNGHTISNFRIDDGDEGVKGFFGYTNEDAIIKNLTIKNSIINSTFQTTAGWGNVYAGALIGFCRESEITNCHSVNNTITVTGNWNKTVGGLIGDLYGGTVNQCSNSSTITAFATGVGGIIGINGSTAVIENCYNTGTIKLTGSYEKDGEKDVPGAGGIVGKCVNNFTINNCHNQGNISCIDGVDGEVGSIIGGKWRNKEYESGIEVLVNSCYYKSGTANKGLGYGDDEEGIVSPLTAAQFKEKSSFEGWNFAIAWKMGDNYPIIRETVNIYPISLSNGSATTTGTTVIYENEGDTFYLEQACTNKMTTTENAITIPTKTGYTFDGYYTSTTTTGVKYIDANGYLTSSANADYFTAAGTLYAKWTPISYEITLNPNGGEGSGKVTITYDEAATIPGTGITREHCSIEGWYLDIDTEMYFGTSLVDTEVNYLINNEIDTLYAKWSLPDFVQDTINKIKAIGTVYYTATCKGKIDEARSAYDGLSVYSEQDDFDYTQLIDNYSTLTNAESAYSTLSSDAISDVINSINNLGEIAYSTSHDALIETEGKYDNLVDEDKTYITNYGTLTQARTNYDTQRAVKLQEVIAAIDAIGEIAYPQSEEKLYNAVNLFAGLLQEDKTNGSITNKNDLVGKETDYYELRDAAIANVNNLINAIAKPLVYPTAKDEICAARDAFDALARHDQNETDVDKYGLLLDIEKVDAIYDSINNIGDVEDTTAFRDKVSAIRDAYNSLDSSIQAYLPSSSSTIETLGKIEDVIDVMDIINAIGDVEYSSESKGKIVAAQDAYNALDNDLKDSVANNDKLVQANTDYNNVDEAVTKINNLPAFEYSDEYKDALDEVKGYYDSLTPYQKSILPTDSLTDLTEAVNEYEAFDSIYNIGEIENTPESKNRIKRAKDAYDALTDAQKEEAKAHDADFPKKVAHLLDAVAAYDVIDKINSVKRAGYSTKDKENIDAARTAYTALTDDQKEIFPADALTLLANIETAYPLMVTINKLGNVEYTDEYKAKLDSAKVTYDALTDAQKDLVRNYVVLSVDIQSYNKVDNAYKAIENINKVKYNNASKETIEEARKQYNKLSDDEKELITNSDKLIQAEKKYEKAEHSHNVGMAWLAGILITFGVVIVATGLWLLIILILKRRKEKEEEENKKNKKNSKKTKK